MLPAGRRRRCYTEASTLLPAGLRRPRSPGGTGRIGDFGGPGAKAAGLSDCAPRDLKTINFNVATLAQGGADAEVIGRQYLESLNKLRTDCRKAVEAALTPEQLEQLKKLALVDMADRALHDYPEIATARSFEPGTGGELRTIRMEVGQRLQRSARARLTGSLPCSLPSSAVRSAPTPPIARSRREPTSRRGWSTAAP